MSNTWVNLLDDDMKSLLVALIGNDFGLDPETRVAEIRASRRDFANYIADKTKISPSDIVLDLGSGCGFGTSRLAERAAQIFACDVSSAYLKFAKRECEHLNNISYHLIEPRQLTGVDDHSVDVVVSMSVFIHFNLYDIYFYFRELERVVKPSGRVWIDVADSEAIDFFNSSKATDYFLSQGAAYEGSPEMIAGLMQWNSLKSVSMIADACGFSTSEKNEHGQMIFAKRS